MKNAIYPCLWFNGNAKEAAVFYTSIFKNARIIQDTPMVVTFELNGQSYMGLNGGPMFSFTEAISLVISCDTQEEIDYYWSKLQEGGGNESMCGWLKDKFGLSWQVVPSQLGEWMQDSARAGRVMEKLLKMKKLDIATLSNA